MITGPKIWGEGQYQIRFSQSLTFFGGQIRAYVLLNDFNETRDLASQNLASLTKLVPQNVEFQITMGKKKIQIQEILIFEEGLSFKQRVGLLNEFTETRDLAS